MIDFTSKRKLRKRIAELEERLELANALNSQWLDALDEENSTTAARILSRVHGGPPLPKVRLDLPRGAAERFAARLHKAAEDERRRER